MLFEANISAVCMLIGIINVIHFYKNKINQHKQVIKLSSGVHTNIAEGTYAQQNK